MNRLFRSLSLALALSLVALPAAGRGAAPAPETADAIVEALSFDEDEEIIGGNRGRTGVQVDWAQAAPRVMASIQFDSSSARIKGASYSLLDEYGKALTGKLATASLQVEGHTDSQGSAAYNRELGQQRAQSVVAYLVSRFDIDPQRLQARSFGESRPVADNASSTGRTRNRRVEFVRKE